jgi:hypothetical protein
LQEQFMDVSAFYKSIALAPHQTPSRNLLASQGELDSGFACPRLELDNCLGELEENPELNWVSEDVLEIKAKKAGDGDGGIHGSKRLISEFLHSGPELCRMVDNPTRLILAYGSARRNALVRDQVTAYKLVLHVANGSMQLVAQIGINRRGGGGILRFGC